MVEAFVEGGWGMFPTLAFGLLLLGASVRYAARPDSRQVPLLVSLGLLTGCAGALGFVSGIIASFHAVAQVAAGERWIALVGVGESANNLVLALLLATLSMLAVVVGAWRLARSSTVAVAS